MAEQSDRDRAQRRDMNRWNNRLAFAAALRECRAAVGLSREALAAASGVPAELIRELEDADRDSLSSEQTEALAAALNTTWSEITAMARDRARRMPEDQ